jgi:hypothetical protein
MLINSPNISGSLTVTGNTTISGSLTVAGGINATITGSATTASYVEYSNVANKPTLVSGSAQVSFNGITDKPTLVSGSSQVTYSGLSGIPSGIVSSSTQITGYNIFATTGSNQFDGSQAITGSLTVTGQVVAQTLNVQQVTSSIVYSSGSNVFGNSLSNTQQFTGSVSVTGSLTVAGVGANSGIRVGSTDGGRAFIRQSAGGDAEIGAITNGGLFLYANNTLGLSFAGAAATFASSVTANSLLVERTVSRNMLGISSTSLPTSGDEEGVAVIKTNSTIWQLSTVGYAADSKGVRFYNNGGTGYTAFEVAQAGGTRFIVNGVGNVGIGTDNPDQKLNVEGNDANAVQLKIKNNNVSNGNKYLALFVGGTTGFSVSGWANSGGIESAAGTGSNLVLSNYEAGPIIFQTNNRNERMRITSGGDVGINQTNPSGRLEVVPPNAGGNEGIFVNQLGSHQSTIRFKSAHSADSDYRIGASILTGNAFEIFSVNANASRLTISSTGAATFSSTITSTGAISSGGGTFSSYYLAPGNVSSGGTTAFTYNQLAGEFTVGFEYSIMSLYAPSGVNLFGVSHGFAYFMADGSTNANYISQLANNGWTPSLSSTNAGVFTITFTAGGSTTHSNINIRIRKINRTGAG